MFFEKWKLKISDNISPRVNWIDNRLRWFDSRNKANEEKIKELEEKHSCLKLRMHLSEVIIANLLASNMKCFIGWDHYLDRL
jgi:hypothetical protein